MNNWMVRFYDMLDSDNERRTLLIGLDAATAKCIARHMNRSTSDFNLYYAEEAFLV